jgi:hypothetical protein
MVLLLALPVFAAVALVHRYLQLYAPSNLLVRRVRIATPRLGVWVALLAVAAALLVAMHLVAEAVAAGAPGWLNLVVLVLAWDAIKAAWLALEVAVRFLCLGIRELIGGSDRLRGTGVGRVAERRLLARRLRATRTSRSDASERLVSVGDAALSHPSSARDTVRASPYAPRHVSSIGATPEGAGRRFQVGSLHSAQFCRTSPLASGPG